MPLIADHHYKVSDLICDITVCVATPAVLGYHMNVLVRPPESAHPALVTLPSRGNPRRL
ncbi:hypothetical protein B0H10DRAFT_582951 [Mycena sp. CBHHK59/15]|nr:hypothetical protein B0H10DRAFT_582951 [Mycena sp. CBHHK59/15]